jgi:hypothetical protein
LVRGLSRDFRRLRDEELRPYQESLKLAVGSQDEFMWRYAALLYLKGVDAEARMLSVAAEDKKPAVRRAINRARAYLSRVRGERRKREAEIQRERGLIPSFTFENFGVTIDKTQHKDLGMVSISIYCIVEVWDEDEETEKEYLVNFSDFKTKEWLTRLLVWGLMNKKQVHISPATEHAMATMKMFIPKDRVET